METPKNPLFEESYPYVRYKKCQMQYDNSKSVEYFIAPYTLFLRLWTDPYLFMDSEEHK